MIENMLIVGAIGSGLFTCFLALFAISGWVKYLRDEAGRFQKKWNWKAVSSVFIFIVLLLGILLWGNNRLGLYYMDNPTSIALFLNAFGIFFFIHLFDLIIIDYFLIVKWHPKFLNLPDTEYYTTIKPHFIGFVRGLPFGIIGSILATAISIIMT
ncbi:hypothetical protein [Muriicola sp. Z0-33]|uniref:hypothetical protein n=1 Tax=Muriicola sp. Z0-33 TaxID=2816957 RepID=UPI002238F381|nr:hypothetical protein [Muriicola sp. Z0-33]MCW5518029.1 hypothetical protein [Muriicola sp. Z0-33]